MKRATFVPGLVWLIALFATATVPSVTTPASVTTTAPQSGGILKILWSTAPSVFGYPPELAGYNYIHALPAVETLVDLDNDLHFKPSRLSTTLVVSPDGKTMTISLGKGIKFHDGSDFNASAVKWNLDAVRKAKATGTTKWTSVDVLDDYTIRINLSGPDSITLASLGRSTGMQISPTAFQKNGIERARYNPVGTGPFRFKSFQRGVSLKYEKFDGYSQGLPYLDGVEYYFVTDPMVQVASFKAGEEQVLYRAKGQQAYVLKSDQYTALGAMTSMMCMFPDSKNPESALSNQKVREALEYAIDREKIANSLGYGFWRATHQPGIPELPAGYNADIKGRAYDPAKARQLLTEAGYAKGFKTKIIVDSSYQVNDALVAIQSYWKAIGVDMTMEIVDRATLDQYRVANGWHDGFIFSVTDLDPLFLLSLDRLLSPENKLMISTLRPSGWADLMKQARAATNPDTTTELTKKLQR
ncbi:MAG: ABC transporter substrate-binding protein, partial [Methanothrix sp.]|nr:ABC transporter substrate-binding protein [Methanothrix sp.]